MPGRTGRGRAAMAFADMRRRCRATSTTGTALPDQSTQHSETNMKQAPDNNSIDPQQQRRSRFTLLGVLLVFVAPILLAVYLQSDLTDYSPAATTNSGLLLDPPIPVNAWEPRQNELGRPLWTLLVYTPEPCVDGCIEHFSWLQQLQLALGRHADQLTLELIGVAPDAEQAAQLTELGVTEVHLLDATEPLTLAAEMAVDEQQRQPWQTLLLDPNGYFVLRYDHNADITGMRKDIDRLIRQSNKAQGLN